jgi:hypothetical protein
MKWIQELRERREQKTTSEKEQYVALLFKGASEGDLNDVDKRKLETLMVNLKIGADEMAADADAIVAYLDANKRADEIPAVEAEIAKIEQAIAQHNADFDEFHKQFAAKAKELGESLDKPRMRMIGLTGQLQRIKQLKLSHPDLFASIPNI